MEDETVGIVAPAPVVDVKLDEKIFDELEKNMIEVIKTVKEKETIDTEQTEKMDELLQKMIENEDAAAEKALLDAEAEMEAKELAESESLVVEEIDPDVIDLAEIYKLIQQKMKDDAEAFNHFEYLTCEPMEEVEEIEELEEVEEELEQVLTLCNHFELNNEKLDDLIGQNHLISIYGLAIIPSVFIVFLFYKIMKWFT